MISGTVTARREAVVKLRLRGPTGVELDVAAVVDTGFTSSLTLPAVTVAFLGLAHQTVGGALLADGSVRQFDIHEVEVLWDGTWRKTLVSSLGTESLIGMTLLNGHRLRIDAKPGGTVEITPLP